MNLTDEIIFKRVNLEVDQIRWAANMSVSFLRETHDYGHEMSIALVNRFVRWPEDGVTVVEYPKSWVDHLKQYISYRFPRLYKLLGLSYSMHTEEYRAIWVLPDVSLPPELKRGMFPVHFGQPKYGSKEVA